MIDLKKDHIQGEVDQANKLEALSYDSLKKLINLRRKCDGHICKGNCKICNFWKDKKAMGINNN